MKEITFQVKGEIISRTELYLITAALQSLRSVCKRGKNGAIITGDNRIISTGYNGPIMKGVSCEELGCDVSQKCNNAMHAEANAIAFAARYGISLAGTTIYCTSAPCFDCAKLIIQSGIKVVLYEHEYTTDGGAGLRFLQSNNIEVYQK